MLQIEVTQAQESLPQLIEAAAQGEEVIITRAALPVAKLVATQRREGDLQLGSAADLVTFSDHFDEPLQRNGRLIYGSAAGKIHMSEDFDEPLEEFAEY